MQISSCVAAQPLDAWSLTHDPSLLIHLSLVLHKTLAFAHPVRIELATVFLSFPHGKVP